MTGKRRRTSTKKGKNNVTENNNNLDLTREVWSEPALMELLGLKKNQIRRLRTDHGLPMRRLQVGTYVALTGELLNWLKSRPIAGQDAEDSDETAKDTPNKRKDTP